MPETSVEDILAMQGEDVRALLLNPDALLLKKPFTRGFDVDACAPSFTPPVGVGEKTVAKLPTFRRETISQDVFLRELDPNAHKVLFDDNIPSITMKVKGGGYMEVEYKKMAVAFQRNILEKQVLHLCGRPLEHTLLKQEPSEEESRDFMTFKEYWMMRNQDGMRTKMVRTQLSQGDAGLLYYFDRKGRVKCRLLSYEDGYVLCPHDDQNGDRILDSVYYSNENGEYIDSYDDKYMWRYRRSAYNEDGTPNVDGGWILEPPREHGFSESPLITKRGDVAWSSAQSIIDVYEVIYNIFLVIQKRNGWGILYIKGRFKDEGKRIAGNIILNDTSLEGKGSADFKTPPSPQGMLDTLTAMEESIQKACSTTFILPKDIHTGGDVSGVAVMLTQSMDIEKALEGAIEWQNVADKMTRLFLEGLAKELVGKGEDKSAITRMGKMRIGTKFVVWRPQSETETANVINLLKGAGVLSQETGAEISPYSKPDELSRIRKEARDAQEKAIEASRTPLVEDGME